MRALFALALLAAPGAGYADVGPGRVLVLVSRPRRAAFEEAMRIELADRAAEVVGDEAPAGDAPDERARAVTTLLSERAASAAVWIEPPAIPGSLPAVSALDAVTGQVRYAPLPRPTARVDARVFAVVAVSLLDELAREAVPPEPAPAAEPAPAEAAPASAEAAPAAAAHVTVEVGRPAAPAVRPALEAAPGVGLDFVPFLGSSLATGGRGTRWLSLNAIGGMSRRLAGFELSGVVGIVRGDVSGVQLAGVAALGAGDVEGLQLGGVLDLAGGSVDGVQLAGVGCFAGGPVGGVQLAGVASYAGGPTEGLQLSGVVNVAIGNVRGAQVGVVNIATGDVEGLQLGVVNVSRRTTVPIGLVSVMRAGKLAVEVTGTDAGLVTGALLHGAGPLHVQYRVGARPFGDALLQVGVGLGATLPLRDAAMVVIDLTADHLAPPSDLAALGILSTLRAGAGLRIGPRLSVLGALTYSALVTGRAEEAVVPDSGIGLFRSRSAAVGGSQVLTWPGVQLGLRIE